VHLSSAARPEWVRASEVGAGDPAADGELCPSRPSAAARKLEIIQAHHAVALSLSMTLKAVGVAVYPDGLGHQRQPKVDLL